MKMDIRRGELSQEQPGQKQRFQSIPADTIGKVITAVILKGGLCSI